MEYLSEIEQGTSLRRVTLVVLKKLLEFADPENVMEWKLMDHEKL